MAAWSKYMAERKDTTYGGGVVFASFCVPRQILLSQKVLACPLNGHEAEFQ